MLKKLTREDVVKYADRIKRFVELQTVQHFIYSYFGNNAAEVHLSTSREYDDEGYDGGCFITGFNDCGEHISSRDISGMNLPSLHAYTDEESQPEVLQFMFSMKQAPTCPELYIKL